MSTSLYWSRIPVEPKEESIDGLKRTLAKRLWDEDGSCGNGGKVGKELIPFLEGVVAGNGSGDVGRDAKKLIAAIERYGEVNVVIHS